MGVTLSDSWAPADLEVGDVHEDVEVDWVVALEVFRASLPGPGDKDCDDRPFIKAMHYFANHNITWRALLERFGKWNSVWKCFDRQIKAGVCCRPSSITSPHCRSRHTWCRYSVASSCMPVSLQQGQRGTRSGAHVAATPLRSI